MGRDDGSDYGAAAVRRCIEDIERLTRFDAGDLRGQPARIETLAVRIDQQILVASQARTSTAAGAVSGNGPAAGSAAEFDRLVAGEAQAARTNPAVSAAVADHARATAFGGLQAEWSLGDHPRRVRRQRTCDSCGGRGRNRCHGCNGQRQLTCSACGGRRVLRCNSCGGSGGTRTTITRADGSQEWREDRCIFCHGAGQLSCNYCIGGMVNCGTCGARGEVDCSPCGAHGTVTDIATIGLSARSELRLGAILPDFPRAAHAIEQRVGLRGLAALTARQDNEWAVPAPGRIEGRTRFDIPACEVAMQGGGQLFHMLALGDDAAIWDYDGVIEHLLEADLAGLEEAVAAFRTLGRDGDEAAFAAVRLFCESEANQDLLTAAGATADDAAVAERLKGTVSADYVTRSAEALKRFAARRTRREVLLALAIAIPVALLAAAGLTLVPVDGKGGLDPQQLRYLSIFAALAVLLAGIGIAGWRAGRALRALGGKPLGTFCRRPGLGFFRRLFIS